MTKRKRLTRSERLQVYEKYGGCCAYCGKPLSIDEMQVDHKVPLRLGGEDGMGNYMPSCRMCNHYKGGNSLEGFRRMVEAIPDKLERDSYIYRVGMAYGNVRADKRSVAFYFEKEENDEI